MNPIRNARRTSRQAHLNLGGIYVQIERDGQKSEPIRVTVGYAKNFEQDNTGGYYAYRTRAYIINVADYSIDGVLLEPQVGDYILETIDAQVRRFEVDHDTAEPEMTHPDAARQEYRINTKEVHN